jgi:uridine kinase/glycerol-3-phosphate responsive antiterminator
MKNALLISGYTRSLKENYNNLQRYVLENNNIDIFIHVTLDTDQKYKNYNVSLDEIYNLIKPKGIIMTKNYKFNENNEINDVLNQNYKFFLLNEERKRIERIEKMNYNVIIKIRPDVNLQEKIDINIEKNKIYIPKDTKIDKHKLKNKDDKYICDIIAYGYSNIIDEYLNIYKELPELIEMHGTVNETLLYNYLHNNKIVYELVDINYAVILSLCNTIAITGDSGSGKTTISKIIKNIFNDSFILECDRYHKWEREDINWNKYTHLNPEANYISKMTTDVFDLKIGKNIYQVDYDHKSGKFTDKELIESKTNIIVCGLHSLYLPDNITNLKIYIDTDDNLRKHWKIKRDMKKRGYSFEKIMEQINNRKCDFDMYIHKQKEEADIIINYYTNTIFDINNLNLDNNPSVFLRIGIKESYNLSNIIKTNKIEQIEYENQFVYLYFSENNNYEDIIKMIIINLQ